jgi:hypothetical protein
MSTIDEALAKKLGYQGSKDCFVELLKNTIPISFDFFYLQASNSCLITPSLINNVNEKLFWLDDGSKIYVQCVNLESLLLHL